MPSQEPGRTLRPTAGDAEPRPSWPPAAEAGVHQRLRDLTSRSRAASPRRLRLGAAHRGPRCSTSNTLLGARRTSVWLHQRRARELSLLCLVGRRTAATAAAGRRPATRRAAGPRAAPRPAADAVDGPEPVLLAPLRGWRRALGTLVVEGPSTGDLDAQQLIDARARAGPAAVGRRSRTSSCSRRSCGSAGCSRTPSTRSSISSSSPTTRCASCR